MMTGEFPTYYKNCIKSVTNDKIKQPFHTTSSYFDQISEHSVFLETAAKYAIVVDCSQFASNFSREKTLEVCLRDQFPNAAGIRFKATTYPAKEYVIISFNTDSECNLTLQKQFIFQGKTIHVCRSLPKSCQVVHIDISKIPLPCTNDVRDRLIEIFSEYGEILAMGKYISKVGHWFSGYGYVTLIVDKSKNYKQQLNTKNNTTEKIVYASGILLFLECRVSESQCSICLNDYHNVLRTFSSPALVNYPDPSLCPH